MKNITVIFFTVICILSNNSYSQTQQICKSDSSIFDDEKTFLCNNLKYYDFSLVNQLFIDTKFNDESNDDDNEEISINLFYEELEDFDKYFVLDNLYNNASIQYDKCHFHFYESVVLQLLFDIFWLGKNKYL
ncbi:MAG: hypothetical protein LBS69_08860 [Prevotellaceae bacterium]|jgi:hypothetical protein|nr:hypothetical protein [Prevotellaceae bacterium]